MQIAKKIKEKIYTSYFEYPSADKYFEKEEKTK